MSLKTISIPPKNNQPASSLIVCLHGWGANLSDLASLASVFNLPEYQFIFPDAPFEHPQVPGGRAWYALEREDYQGLAESRQLLLEFLNSLEETTGIPLSKTVLMGFSQGGAMSLDVGLNLPLAALCIMSGYLHFQPEKTEKNIPPIFITHGKNDPVVPIAMAEKTREELSKIGAKVEYHEFMGGHEIPPHAIELIESFIRGLAI